MKIVPFLCLVALGVTQVIGIKLEEVKENLRRLEGEIKESKEKVQDAIYNVNKYRNDLQFTFNSKTAARQSRDVKLIACITNLLLEEIRVLVHEAKAHGKKPEKCYEHSKIQATVMSTTGYDDLDKCTKKAKGFVEEAQTTIDAVVAAGQALIAELDRIYPDCYSKLSRIMLKCMTRKKTKTDVAFKHFESSAASVRTTGDIAFNQGYRQGIACYSDVMLIARTSVRNITVEGEYCISKS